MELRADAMKDMTKRQSVAVASSSSGVVPDLRSANGEWSVEHLQSRCQ